MGFSIGKALGAATGIATGGLYSTSGGGLLQGGGLGGMIKNGPIGGGIGVFKQGADLAGIGGGNPADPNAGLDLYNNGMMSKAESDAAAKKKQYYGDTLSGLGGETKDYVDRLKKGLDTPTADADLYNQQAGQQRALDNARAGLAGTDTSAMNEQGRRNASFTAAAINEKSRAEKLDLYGQSIANRIEGANKIDNTEKALAIASMKQPVANQQPQGLLGGLFSSFGL